VRLHAAADLPWIRSLDLQLESITCRSPPSARSRRACRPRRFTVRVSSQRPSRRPSRGTPSRRARPSALAIRAVERHRPRAPVELVRTPAHDHRLIARQLCGPYGPCPTRAAAGSTASTRSPPRAPARPHARRPCARRQRARVSPGDACAPCSGPAAWVTPRRRGGTATTRRTRPSCERDRGWLASSTCSVTRSGPASSDRQSCPSASVEARRRNSGAVRRPRAAPAAARADVRLERAGPPSSRKVRHA
jgi:hypothetical protein